LLSGAAAVKASELQDLIVATLVRQQGGTARRWRLAVGPVRVYDPATHPDINWSVEPHGTGRDNAAIERLLDDVRLTHSIVTKG
jgi:hypothetical protein